MGYLIEFLFRWFHVISGVTWVGLLYYFNFIQGEYFKEAEADAKADALKKLAPRALWWFRWAAVATFATGVYLLGSLGAGINQYIAIAALMGTIMFLNVWLIIWPKQKIVCGLKSGDVPSAAATALLASRTNTVFSAPMLFGMLASKHGSFSANAGGMQPMSFSDFGFLVALVIVILIALNGVFGQLWKMAGIRGALHLSFVLTAVLYGLIHFL